MLDALATGASTTLIAAIVGAVGAIAAAALMAVVAWRAQSAQDQIKAIKDLLSDEADRAIDELKADLREILDARSRGVIIGEIVKRGLREVLGSPHPGRRRRWYDRD